MFHSTQSHIKTEKKSGQKIALKNAGLLTLICHFREDATNRHHGIVALNYYLYEYSFMIRRDQLSLYLLGRFL